MATAYLQLRRDSVPSTQDVAREAVDTLPVLVMAREQTAGRGRSGSGWVNADRALAVSLAFHREPGDNRPFSLMAGLAIARVASQVELKWPNDVLKGDLKVGGILVEGSDDVVVIGLGLNLWWPDPPEGAAGLLDEDPGEGLFGEVGGLWGAELMGLVDGRGWPLDEYRARSVTVGRDITWEPSGSGRAVDVANDGGLVVEADGVTETIYSGAVRHISS